MNRRIRQTIVGAALLSGLTFGAAGTAFAQSSSTTPTTPSSSTSATPAKPCGGGKLADLVAAGTITQAQADAVHAALHAARPTTKPTTKPTTRPTAAERQATAKAALAPLVTAGTISQAQADAIVANIGTEPEGGRGGRRGHGGAPTGRSGDQSARTTTKS
jgi:hypothetical protein